MNSWYSHFVGLFPILESYTLLGGILAALGAIVWFRPALWKPVAITVAVLLYGAVTYSVGLKHGLDRKQAQWDNEKASINETVDEAVDHGNSAAANGMRDPFQLD